MFFLLLPVWFLALRVTWRRSVRFPKSHRIALLACLTIAMAALAEGLDLWITAGMLRGANTALAFQHAHRVDVFSWAAFSISTMFFALFVLFAIRGSRIVKRRQRSNQSVELTATRATLGPSDD